MSLTNDALAKFIKEQAETISLLNAQLQQSGSSNQQPVHSQQNLTNNIPWPLPLETEKGDVSQNFEHFVDN